GLALGRRLPRRPREGEYVDRDARPPARGRHRPPRGAPARRTARVREPPRPRRPDGLRRGRRLARFRARPRASSAPCAPGHAARGDRARLLRRLLAVRAGREAGSAAGYDQEQDVRRPRAPTGAARRGGIRGIVDAETHELIAGYALDALDEGDRARAKELVESSEEAHEEVRARHGAATATARTCCSARRGRRASVATATVGPSLSTALRAGLLAPARAEPQNVVAL